jgi:hypothetical protein
MKALLLQINEVPYTDNREGEQLSLLMKGVAMINNQAMDNAAIRAKENLKEWELQKASKNRKKTSQNDDELAKLRPIR